MTEAGPQCRRRELRSRDPKDIHSAGDLEAIHRNRASFSDQYRRSWRFATRHCQLLHTQVELRLLLAAKTRGGHAEARQRGVQSPPPAPVRVAVTAGVITNLIC